MFTYPIFYHYDHSNENQLAASAAAHDDPSQSVIIVWDQLYCLASAMPSWICIAFLDSSYITFGWLA